LAACVHDQRFDGQVEGPRGAWLWQLIEVVGARERFRVPILHALYDLADDRSASQLCELALRYAQVADDTFRSRLYEIVERKPVADSPWLGEEEIITLDGETAFLVAARVRGQSLAGREWDWDDRSLSDFALKQFGQEPVRRLLESSSDEAVKRFRDAWQNDKQMQGGPRQQPSHRDRMAATTVEAVLRATERDDKCFWLRGWGIHADEPALRMVLQHLWSVSEPTVLAKLLRVFSARALPVFDPRLIELCRHGDREVRRRALVALGENTDPLIREYALNELRNGVEDGAVVALFINNYEWGDEQRILEAMEFPDDECELHWLLMDAVKVLEKHPVADCSRLAVIAYASTPCETCRFYAARLLLNQWVAPEWLKDECRHDSCDDCRALAAQGTGSAGAG
jgi:hypothetical protein